MVNSKIQISEAIISAFEVKQQYTVAELLDYFTNMQIKCSQRAAYKELRNLLSRGVLVKTGKQYSLSLTWIITQIEKAKKLYSTLADKKLLPSFLPNKDEKKIWKFFDLELLDKFWIQMIFLLFEQSIQKQMYVWVPYFWFDLIHYQKDLEAQAAMKAARNHMYMLLGYNCFLTRLPEKYWDKSVYTWHYHEHAFPGQDNIYYDVIDDYVMSIELTRKTSREIKELFDEIKNKNDLEKIKKFLLIKSNAPSKLMIEHNTKKANKLRKHFAEFF